MNLSYLGELVSVCPPLMKSLSMTDEGDLIRIVINPDCIPDDTHAELLATFAEENMLPHFGAWEAEAEFALCFTLEDDDCNIAFEVFHPSGHYSYLNVEADEEEIATMLSPLVVVTDMDAVCYDSLAELIPGLDFGGKYDTMIKNVADAFVAVCYYHSVADNEVLFQLPYYERAFEKALPRFVPCLIDPFIDLCNAVKAVGK